MRKQERGESDPTERREDERERLEGGGEIKQGESIVKLINHRKAKHFKGMTFCTCVSGSREESFSLPSFLFILLSWSVSLVYCRQTAAM